MLHQGNPNSHSPSGFPATQPVSIPLGGNQKKRGRCQSNESQSSAQGPPTKLLALASSGSSSTSLEDLTMTSGALGGTSYAQRDEDYYFDDGSCILLVEDTLFNVHRSMLSRDSSSFRTMFSLPQGHAEPEGRSDSNPIILVGDTVSEFRNFLWALYALPPELQVVTSPKADLIRPMDIARVANKYSFKTLETWALDAIQDYVNQKPCPILASASAVESDQTQTVEQLTQLLRLAQLCHHDRLLATLISLLKQLMSVSIQYAYLAMTIADEYDLRSLKGIAYLEVMQKSNMVAAVGGGPFPLPPGTSTGSSSSGGVHPASNPSQHRLKLSPSQRLRLLSGHYRLVMAWERVRSQPPQFVHVVTCGSTWHQHGCTQSWTDFWKEKTKCDPVLSLSPADVLGRLKQMLKEFDKWGSVTYMHHDCRLAARTSIQDTSKAVEDALPEYFSDRYEDSV